MNKRTVIVLAAITWRVAVASLLVVAVFWTAKLDLPYPLAVGIDIVAIFLGIIALRFPLMAAERRALDEHSE